MRETYCRVTAPDRTPIIHNNAQKRLRRSARARRTCAGRWYATTGATGPKRFTSDEIADGHAGDGLGLADVSAEEQRETTFVETSAWVPLVYLFCRGGDSIFPSTTFPKISELKIFQHNIWTI